MIKSANTSVIDFNSYCRNAKEDEECNKGLWQDHLFLLADRLTNDTNRLTEAKKLKTHEKDQLVKCAKIFEGMPEKTPSSENAKISKKQFF